MKRGLKVLIGLALLSVIGFPAFSQPSVKNVETIVLDNFDTEGQQQYYYQGQELSWNWAVNSSRFIAEGYPKTGYYSGIPNSLKSLRKSDDPEAKVFGVKTAFNRKGDNWFEIYPEVDGKAYKVPLIGNVTQIDFWVWGANYNYYLEVLIQDANGRVHVLNAGSLAFEGWKNVVVPIPGWMVQQSKLRSGPKSMSFVGFRIRTDAEEYVDNYVVFFDQLKYMSHTLDYIYDGYDLNEIKFDDEESK